MPRRERRLSPKKPEPRKESAIGLQPVENSRPMGRLSGAVMGFLMGACTVYYIWIANLAPGDFQGDSWEYLSIASQMRTGTFELGSYRYMRGLLYPWLLSVTWGHDGSATYFIQVLLFLVSFYLALRVLTFGSVYCILPICVAMVPAISFLQKLAYPDGLLVSLTLLFFVCLARRQWAVCAGLGVLLALTKLVFAVVLPVALIVFLFQRGTLSLRMLGRAFVAALALAPVGGYLFNYAFADLGYMVAFARPYAAGYPIESVFPGSELGVTCGGRQHTISRSDLFFEPVTAPYSLAAYGPLTEDEAVRWGCTKNELRSLKRRLVEHAFEQNPLRHLRLGVQTFFKTVAGLRDVAHVSYMLMSREKSWLAHYDERSYFGPFEITLLPEYRKKGFEIVQRPSVLFALNDLCSKGGQALLSFAVLGVLGACAAISYRRGRLMNCVRDPANVGMILFLAAYSWSVAASTPLIYDRYTFINLLILSILAARVAAMTFDGRNDASSG